jgi:hypothetical protein
MLAVGGVFTHTKAAFTTATLNEHLNHAVTTATLKGHLKLKQAEMSGGRAKAARGHGH